MDDLPEHPESFFVSAVEARGQVEDCIECGKVTACSEVLLAQIPVSTALYDS